MMSDTPNDNSRDPVPNEPSETAAEEQRGKDDKAELVLEAEVDGRPPEAGKSDAEPAADAEMDLARLDNIIEALLLASEQPLSLDALQRLVAEEVRLERKPIRAALARLHDRYTDSAMELREVASGFRLQVRSDYALWIHRLWQDKPPRLSRALLETLAIICYRQPVTRGEIEDIRGVAVSSNILRTLLERGWVREVGVKEVPGRPSLFGTTSQLLDDLGLASMDQLPSLPEIKDPAQLEAALARLGLTPPALPVAESGEAEAVDEPSAPEPGADAEDSPSDPTVH
jgi:segregation and condensation protein B